jgi:hypothetical protein
MQKQDNQRYEDEEELEVVETILHRVFCVVKKEWEAS